MKDGNMFTQCTPWPGNFSTYITCMGETSDVVSFNVPLHILVWPLLSTNITRSHLSLSSRKRYFTSCDHWLYLFIQFLQLHIDFVIPNSNCCVIGYLWRLILKGWLWKWCCEFTGIIFLQWDTSVLCCILVCWVSFSISTTLSKGSLSPPKRMNFRKFSERPLTPPPPLFRKISLRFFPQTGCAGTKFWCKDASAGSGI